MIAGVIVKPVITMVALGVVGDALVGVELSPLQDANTQMAVTKDKRITCRIAANLLTGDHRRILHS